MLQHCSSEIKYKQKYFSSIILSYIRRKSSISVDICSKKLIFLNILKCILFQIFLFPKEGKVKIGNKGKFPGGTHLRRKPQEKL